MTATLSPLYAYNVYIVYVQHKTLSFDNPISCVIIYHLALPNTSLSSNFRCKINNTY